MCSVQVLSRSSLSQLLSCRRSELGRGAYSVVSLVSWGEEESSGDDLAVVKLLKKGCPQSLFQKERFFLEQLDGTGGAPRLLAISHDPPALVTTFQGPDTLFQILQSYKLPDWYLGILGLEVGHRLREIHRAGVVHNDLHSQNIIVSLPQNLDYRPEVKIIDFGLAQVYKSSLERDLEGEEGARTGTFNWTGTPEKDLYCLGCIWLKLMHLMENIPLSAWPLLEKMRGKQESLDVILEELRRIVYHELICSTLDVSANEQPYVPTSVQPYNPSEISYQPTEVPDYNPTQVPDYNPTKLPDYNPTELPDYNPTELADYSSTEVPDYNSTKVPGCDPSQIPDYNPTQVPDYSPTEVPVYSPTQVPDYKPTEVPDYNSTKVPVYTPVQVPNYNPTKLSDYNLTEE